MACKKGDSNELINLFATGYNVNGRDDNGNTPLFYAAENGHINCLAICIEKRADISASNNVVYLHSCLSERRMKDSCCSNNNNLEEIE